MINIDYLFDADLDKHTLPIDRLGASFREWFTVEYTEKVTNDNEYELEDLRTMIDKD